MKTLILGAGPMGCLYAHLLHQAAKPVTLLARGERHAHLSANGVRVVDEITGDGAKSAVRLTDRLSAGDDYELVIVLVRRNRLPGVFDLLENAPQVEHILFMGNNAAGFTDYLARLAGEKLLFGFPGAGGGMEGHVLHYADRETPTARRHPVTLGEIDGKTRSRTIAIRSLFIESGVPVDLVDDIDGWLKYHAALVSPLGNALLAHGGDGRQLAADRETVQAMLEAVREGGRVLAALGHTRRQPFRFNLFYWLPDFLNAWGVRRLLRSRFADIAFSRHARVAPDELAELSEEFRTLARQTSVPTPCIDSLRASAHRIAH